jgi:ApaG protein
LNQLNTYLLLYNGFSNNKRHKISVLTSFEGTYFKNYKLHYAFSYQITIENNSKDTVQLVTRHWEIFDSLNENEIVVEGEELVKPVLRPG